MHQADGPDHEKLVMRIDHNKEDINFILFHDATDQLSLMLCEAIDGLGSDCESSC